MYITFKKFERFVENLYSICIVCISFKYLKKLMHMNSGVQFPEGVLVGMNGLNELMWLVQHWHFSAFEFSVEGWNTSTWRKYPKRSSVWLKYLPYAECAEPKSTFAKGVRILSFCMGRTPPSRRSCTEWGLCLWWESRTRCVPYRTLPSGRFCYSNLDPGRKNIPSPLPIHNHKSNQLPER